MDREKLGRRAEALVEALVKASGWHYVEDAQFGDDGAPMIRGEGGDYIRPDLSVARGGQRVWIEVKGKTDSTPYEGVPRHGIDRYNWEEYNRVASVTGDECWLFVYEQSTGVLLCHNIAELPVADERIKGSYDDEDPYGCDMVFFNKTDFNVKQIGRAQYPREFFGQDKLPLSNVADEPDAPLFPDSPIGRSEPENHDLNEFVRASELGDD
jgi:hypothetical protein